MRLNNFMTQESNVPIPSVSLPTHGYTSLSVSGDITSCFDSHNYWIHTQWFAMQYLSVDWTAKARIRWNETPVYTLLHR